MNKSLIIFLLIVFAFLIGVPFLVYSKTKESKPEINTEQIAFNWTKEMGLDPVKVKCRDDAIHASICSVSVKGSDGNLQIIPISCFPKCNDCWIRTN